LLSLAYVPIIANGKLLGAVETAAFEGDLWQSSRQQVAASQAKKGP
jgi:GAF domain-containing protein